MIKKELAEIQDENNAFRFYLNRYNFSLYMHLLENKKIFIDSFSGKEGTHINFNSFKVEGDLDKKKVVALDSIGLIMHSDALNMFVNDDSIDVSVISSIKDRLNFNVSYKELVKIYIRITDINDSKKNSYISEKGIGEGMNKLLKEKIRDMMKTF